jgi:G3E family GTPase
VTNDLPDPTSLVLIRQAPIPVAIVTGFLGSGKTTLIRALLQDPELLGTAVVVNEFGEVGLDHLLLEAAQDDTILLEGGCLCCAARGDLVRALRSLLDRRERAELPAYRRVIVETSGLADPAPILQTLMTDPLRLSRYKLGALTTTVDCLLGVDTLDRYAEATRQVTLADRILITKTDLADEKQLAATIGAVRNLTVASIGIAAVEQSAGEALFRPLSGNIDFGHFRSSHRNGAAYAAVTRSIDRALPWRRVEAWLSSAVERCGPDLLRLKAILAIEGEDRPVVFHAVQHVIHRPERLSTWPDGPQQGHIVIISQTLERSFLNQMLDELVS